MPITGTKTQDDEQKAQVRFQFQTGDKNIYSTTRTNSMEVGVLKQQGYSALDELFAGGVSTNVMFAKDGKFATAIIQMSMKIKSLNGGLISGPYQTDLQEKFEINNVKYRIDVESFRGINFQK